MKVFAGDFSLFSLVCDPNESSVKVGRDSGRVSQRAFQWKMSFSPDPSKQAVDVYFSRKVNPVDTPPVYFNNLAAASCKYIGLLLDRRLAFDRHVDEIVVKANKSIKIIRRIC